MATSANVNMLKEEPLKEDFADLLTCTICLETFKQPKYLPCLHTFCESCIHTYIVSTVKAEKQKGFKCPVCRRHVPIVESEERPETWAETLPGNHFVVSMIDRRAMNKAEKLCDACSSENITQKAISLCTICEEAYCDSCERNHKKYKMTRNHKIVPIRDINEDSNISNIFAFVACDEHPEKTIEIYCKDHSKPCCTICATVHHRKCEHVVTIDKAVCGVKDSSKALELLKKLREASKNLGEIINTRNKKKTNFEKEIELVLVEIANLREKLNKKLDKLENKLKEEVNSTRKNNVLRLNEESSELISLKSTFDNWKNLFEACLSQGSEIQCLVKMEEISRKMPNIENDLSRIKQGLRDMSVKFVATEIIPDTVCFGRLLINEGRQSLPGFRSVNFHSGKIKVLFKINITGNYISGIFFQENIIITDYVQNRIVCHDNNGKQTEVLNVPNPPTDITRVNDQTIAVSSNAKKIFIINIKPFSLIKTFDINVPTWGLCLVENEYITANSRTISWLNAKTGAKINEISIGAFVMFVTCSNRNEYIYMNGSKSVKRQSADGKGFQYNHDNLTNSYNQEIDVEGNIYVVGYSSNNIHQLTPNGQLIRIIPISDIDNTINTGPWVMRFKQNTNRFLLTFHGSANPVFVCEID